jgi:hypothetical protein
MQTHECRLKLDAAGSHLSIVRVAIYVVYLRHEIFNMQHKESIPEHLSYKLKGNLDKCKKTYTDYLNTNGMKHDEIMTALKVELNDRRITGNILYQQGLLKWINDKSFEQYRGRKLEPVDTGYGTEML